MNIKSISRFRNEGIPLISKYTNKGISLSQGIFIEVYQGYWFIYIYNNSNKGL